MTRKSSIQRLPQQIKDEYLRLTQDEGKTIEQIVEHMRAMGASLSWSAVQRDRKKREVALERINRARDMAAALGKQLKDLPEEDHERATQELLHANLLQAATNLSQLEEPGMGDVLDGAIAADKLASAKKKTVETYALREKIRAEERARAVKEGADAATKAAKKQGLSATTVQAIRAAVLGIAAPPTEAMP
jgi:hypothetical protein